MSAAASLRKTMVDSQTVARGVVDGHVLEAMRTEVVCRHSAWHAPPTRDLALVQCQVRADGRLTLRASATFRRKWSPPQLP